VGTVLEIGDGLTADQHQIHSEALGLQLGNPLLGALDDVGVIATTQAPITSDSDQADGGHIAQLQERRFRFTGTHVGLEIFQNPG
jgi:hypothetical protein